MISLYDFLKENGGDYDVYDYRYDAPGVAWCLPDTDDMNDLDSKVFINIASQIEIVKAINSFEVVAKISDYVERNLSLLYTFTKGHRYEISDDPNQLDENVFIGILTLNSLAVGGYPDEEYEHFLRLEEIYS